MAKKWHKPEEIVAKLRQVATGQSRGMSGGLRLWKYRSSAMAVPCQQDYVAAYRAKPAAFCSSLKPVANRFAAVIIGNTRPTIEAGSGRSCSRRLWRLLRLVSRVAPKICNVIFVPPHARRSALKGSAG